VVSHSYEITAGIVTLYLSGYVQPLPVRSYSSTRDLVKPGTDCWDRRPLNHCLLATRPRHCTSPLNKYLYAFFFVSASCSSFLNRRSPSHSTITRRRPPHVLWYHISYEITASIVTLEVMNKHPIKFYVYIISKLHIYTIQKAFKILAGCIYPPL